MYFHNNFFVIINWAQRKFGNWPSIKNNKKIKSVLNRLNVFKNKNYKTNAHRLYCLFVIIFYYYYHINLEVIWYLNKYKKNHNPRIWAILLCLMNIYLGFAFIFYGLMVLRETYMKVWACFILYNYFNQSLNDILLLY